jgi:hypothetical protein
MIVTRCGNPGWSVRDDGSVDHPEPVDAVHAPGGVDDIAGVGRGHQSSG